MRKIGKIVGITLGVGFICGLVVLAFLALDEISESGKKGRAFASQVRTATVQGSVDRNEYGTAFSYTIFIEGVGFRTLDAQHNLQAPLKLGDRVEVTCPSDINVWCAEVNPKTE